MYYLQESVIANVKSLDSLTQYVAKRSGGREVVRLAMEALQELFCNVLLPDRKLRFLEQQPLQVGLMQRTHSSCLVVFGGRLSLTLASVRVVVPWSLCILILDGLLLLTRTGLACTWTCDTTV